MTCPGCGADVPEDAGFCRACGTIVRGRAAPVRTREPAGGPTARGSAATGAVARSAARGDRGDRSLPLDVALLAAAVVVFVSSLLVWYERTVRVHGLFVRVTAGLLSGNAGIQRPLVPAVAGFLVAEVVANRLVAARHARELRWHRGVVLAGFFAEVVLVASCIASSPLSPDQLANLGISLDPAPASFVGLGAAGAGLVVAMLRMFSGRPSLAGGRRPRA